MESRTTTYVNAILLKLRHELSPGAEQILRGRFERATGVDCSPASVAGKLLGFLAHPDNERRFFRPGRTFAEPNETHLHAILRRLPVGAPSVVGLSDDMHLQHGHRPVEEATAAVVRRIEARDGHHHLTEDVRPPVPASEMRIRYALKQWPEVDDRKIDMIAREWSHRIGHKSPSQILKAVATYLSIPHIAASITRDGKPVKMDHTTPAFGRDADKYDQEYLEETGTAAAHEATVETIRQSWGDIGI